MMSDFVAYSLFSMDEIYSQILEVDYTKGAKILFAKGYYNQCEKDILANKNGGNKIEKVVLHYLAMKKDGLLSKDNDDVKLALCSVCGITESQLGVNYKTRINKIDKFINNESGLTDKNVRN